MSTVTLHLGDCLDILPTLAAGSVDAVVTDPPYSINSKSDGQGKLNPWGDRVNSAFWYVEWMGRCRRLMLHKGCMWSFLNWRSMVTFQKAADDLNWPIESLLIWDKKWIGPGGSKGLRPSYEMVALWAGEDFAIANRGLPDIQAFQWSSNKPNGHPAEKPLDLMEWIIDNSTKPGDTVFDPFMGSGTTGVACVNLGRNFIGCEIDPTFHAIAQRRIAAAQAQLTLPLFSPTGAAL
jgi:site-specific DNA-methyltransferase (adenine-specific)